MPQSAPRTPRVFLERLRALCGWSAYGEGILGFQGQQPVEEGTITLDRHPQVFGGGLRFAVLHFVFASFTGILWLHVFGDNSWPASSETMITVLFVAVFGVLWIGLMTLGYLVGKKLEKDSHLNRKHILISVGLTLLFILLMVFQQWSVGNLGPKSDTVQ